MTVVSPCPCSSISQCQNPQPAQHGGELTLQAATLLSAFTERFSLCPHVSPAVVPRAAGPGVCVQADSVPGDGQGPERHGTQHGDIPRSREAQAWPVLLWSHGSHRLCEESSPLLSWLPLC